MHEWIVILPMKLYSFPGSNSKPLGPTALNCWNTIVKYRRCNGVSHFISNLFWSEEFIVQLSYACLLTIHKFSYISSRGMLPITGVGIIAGFGQTILILLMGSTAME